MKLFTVIFFVTCVYTTVQGQVPGYRGKKVILKMNLNGMPMMGALFSHEKFFDFNLKASVGLDVVVSRRISLGVSIEQTNDIIYLEKYTETDPAGGPYAQAPEKYKSAANYFGYSYGMNLKLFSRGSGSLAPFGRYAIFEYLYNTITVSDDGRFYASGKTDLNNIKSHTLLIGLGSQKVVFNRITLEGTLKYGFNLYGLSASPKASDRLDYDEVYKRSSSKMFSDYLITIGIGIGVLAF